MKALALKNITTPLELIVTEIETPSPKEGEVLIKVFAGGITPSEMSWYPTTHTKDGSPRILTVPGHEFSGVVTKIGPRVSTFKTGDTVFGMNDWFAQGATAEFCLASAQMIIERPSTLSYASAAALPISGLTAWQGLMVRAKILPGEHVVIVGAAGSVGLMAVQLAVASQCRVTAVANGKHQKLLEQLGCSAVVDYQAMRFEQAISGVDVLFDTVGADTLERARPLLTPAGRMITIAADAEGKSDPLIRGAFFIVEPSAQELRELTSLVEQGKLQVFIKESLAFEQAGQAYGNGLRVSEGLGKLVFTNFEKQERS